MKSIRRARPSWDAGLIVVCGECDGSSKALRRGLKEALATQGLRGRVRVVESSCLNLCPKRATAVVTVTPDGSDVLLIPEGTRDGAAFAALVRRCLAGASERIPTDREPSPDPLR